MLLTPNPCPPDLLICSGNYYLLFTSSDFWFGIILTLFLALTPRYLDKAVRFAFFPTDFDILRWIRKKHPERDFANEPQLGGNLKARSQGNLSRMSTNDDDAESVRTGPRRSFQSSRNVSRPGFCGDWRSGSRTDMSTGQITPHRGFNFSVEEGGVAIRRIQTNLSERHSQRAGPSRNHPYGYSSAPSSPVTGSPRMTVPLLPPLSSLRQTFKRKHPDTNLSPLSQVHQSGAPPSLPSSPDPSG